MILFRKICILMISYRVTVKSKKFPTLYMQSSIHVAT